MRGLQFACLFLLATWGWPTAGAAEKIKVFRTGDELVIRLDRFDLLRQNHPGLNAVVQLQGDGKNKDRELPVDLTDDAIQGPLVIDLAKFGRCAGITVTVKNGARQTVATRTVSPVPEIPVESAFDPATGAPAYIEPGEDLRKAMEAAAAGAGKPAAPEILLPKATSLRQASLDSPKRTVAHQDITFPVTMKGAGSDAPLAGGVWLGPQTAAPDDPAKGSLYIGFVKSIYDNARNMQWRKFLVEVPIQNSWKDGLGDEAVTLSPKQYELHFTMEPANTGGANMLGMGDAGLGSKGECTIDEQGRIYWRVEGGGALIVRFNPRTKRFEQPPGRFGFHTFQGLVPARAGTLITSLCRLTCGHGRIFFTLCNDELGTNGNRGVGGVFSIPQDWSNEAAFSADIRLHAGSWETASPTLYKTPPKAGADERKLANSVVTEAGLFISTVGGKYALAGGPWRLDLDAKGNTKFFGEVKSMSDPVAADGTALTPTRPAKSRDLTTWGGNRNLAKGVRGGVEIPRASIRPLLQIDGWDPSMGRRIGGKHGWTTYDGAPSGVVTVRYDVVEKIQSLPAAQEIFGRDVQGGGPSLGPAFLVTPVPGEAAKVLAVCEYGSYLLAAIDLSDLSEKKQVTKSYLPPGLPPLAVGLGPYNSQWLKQDDAWWLYISGYTGMSRIKYPPRAKDLDTLATEMYHARLSPRPLDRQGRGGMKKIDCLLPVFGGRLIDAGYGISNRGGGPYATGIEMFELKAIGDGRSTDAIPSQTLAYMSRCFALKTLRGRVVWNAADGSRRQEIFAASGSVKKQYVDELGDAEKAAVPANLDAKIFLYEVDEAKGLRDLFGFSLPLTEKNVSSESHIVLSPCNRFLVIMTQNSDLYTYSIAQKKFIDGLSLGGGSPIEFHRPSEIIFTSPDGQIFFCKAEGAAINFYRVAVDDRGRLDVVPHLGVACENPADAKDFDRIVRCFMPDLKNQDGSFDFVMGYEQKTVKPCIRVIKDFIPPIGNR